MDDKSHLSKKNGDEDETPKMNAAESRAHHRKLKGKQVFYGKGRLRSSHMLKVLPFAYIYGLILLCFIPSEFVQSSLVSISATDGYVSDIHHSSRIYEKSRIKYSTFFIDFGVHLVLSSHTLRT